MMRGPVLSPINGGQTQKSVFTIENFQSQSTVTKGANLSILDTTGKRSLFNFKRHQNKLECLAAENRDLQISLNQQSIQLEQLLEENNNLKNELMQCQSMASAPLDDQTVFSHVEGFVAQLWNKQQKENSCSEVKNASILNEIKNKIEENVRRE
jgi:predicted choloylglycine hydrolase